MEAFEASDAVFRASQTHAEKNEQVDCVCTPLPSRRVRSEKGALEVDDGVSAHAAAGSLDLRSESSPGHTLIQPTSLLHDHTVYRRMDPGIVRCALFEVAESGRLSGLGTLHSTAGDGGRFADGCRGMVQVFRRLLRRGVSDRQTTVHVAYMQAKTQTGLKERRR